MDGDDEECVEIESIPSEEEQKEERAPLVVMIRTRDKNRKEKKVKIGKVFAFYSIESSLYSRILLNNFRRRYSVTS